MALRFDKLSFLISEKIVIGIISCLILAPALAAQTLFFDENKSAKRLENSIARLDGSFHETRKTAARLPYSDQDLQTRNKVIGEMARAGLAVRIDTAGNIIGRRAGQSDFKQPIVMGSHIDHIIKNGPAAFASIAAALEVVALMNAQDRRTAYPLEIVVFQNRTEGLIGVLGWLGRLGAEDLDQQSRSGFSIADGIKRIGGQPDNLKTSIRARGSIKAFVELQIDLVNNLVNNLTGDQREIGLVTTIVDENSSYDMSQPMINMIERKILNHGYKYQRMTVNAHYSAQYMTSLAPAGLILIPTTYRGPKNSEFRGDETENYINYNALAKGVRVMMDAVLGVDALQAE